MPKTEIQLQVLDGFDYPTKKYKFKSRLVALAASAGARRGTPCAEGIKRASKMTQKKPLTAWRALVKDSPADAYWLLLRVYSLAYGVCRDVRVEFHENAGLLASVFSRREAKHLRKAIRKHVKPKHVLILAKALGVA